MITMTRIGRNRSAGSIKLIILLVAALGIGAGTGWAVWGRQVASKAKSLKESGRDKDDRKGHEGNEEEGEEEAVPLTYVDMGSFLVNLLSESSQLRYLKTDVSLGIVLKEEDEKAKHKPKKGGHGGGKEEEGPKLSPGDDVVARDVIVSVLSRQSFEELSASGPQETLKVRLQKELTGKLQECEVGSVLFTSFVMQ